MRRLLRDTGEAALSFLACLAVGFGLLVLSRSCEAQADACPVVYPECLQRDTLADLEVAGATDWELRAVARLLRHSDRSPVAYVRVSSREVAYSWAHWTAGRDRLELGEHWAPNVSSEAHYWATLAILYSDRAGALQLRAWRRVVGPAVRAARAGGWPEDQIDLVAAMANSAPGEVVRLGTRCRWLRECLVTAWATSPRRRERMR